MWPLELICTAILIQILTHRKHGINPVIPSVVGLSG